jgi:hypothetical protein
MKQDRNIEQTQQQDWFSNRCCITTSYLYSATKKLFYNWAESLKRSKWKYSFSHTGNVPQPAAIKEATVRLLNEFMNFIYYGVFYLYLFLGKGEITSLRTAVPNGSIACPSDDR